MLVPATVVHKHLSVGRVGRNAGTAAIQHRPVLVPEILLTLALPISECSIDTYQRILQGDIVGIHSHCKVFGIALSLRRSPDLQTLVLFRV